MQLRFTKMQGLGNDYLYFDTHAGTNIVRDWPALAQHICDRHCGVGADGIIVIEPSDRAIVRMRIWNADGSAAEMCGNGLRGLVKWLYDRGVRDLSEGIETGAGILVPEVVQTENGRAAVIRAAMGVPDFTRRAIGVNDEKAGMFLKEAIPVGDTEVIGSAVSMGNPHLLVLGELWDVDQMAYWGPQLEQHSWFPQRINVHSVAAVDRHTMHMRHWERGAGLTLACGTGVAAAAAVGVRLDLVVSPVRVRVPGGWMTAEWSGEGTPVYLTGPSAEVFTGDYEWQEP